MRSIKYIGTGMLIKKAFQLLKFDYTILLPYLISSFILLLLSNQLIKTPQNGAAVKFTPELAYFYSIGWLITLFAQAMTIFMTRDALQKKALDLAVVFVQTIKKFFILCILLLLSMFISVVIGVLLKQFLQNYLIYAAIPLGMFVLLFFQLFPVIILMEKYNFIGYFKAAFTFMKNSAYNLIRFFLGISIISLISILLIGSLESAGAFSKELISPFLQGFSGALITLISTIFYLEARSTISANA